MPSTKRLVVAAQPPEGLQSQEAPAPKRRVGRPPGEASTIVNVRLPLSLVARLDHYLDRLEWQTGLKANRGMIARRALELFLEAQEGNAMPSSRAHSAPVQDEPAVSPRRRPRTQRKA